MRQRPEDAAPVFLFGISGATWTILDPMLRAGQLPVLNSLRARGVRATLLSKPTSGDRYPRPQTAWATIATGCEPERHGVIRFYHEGLNLQERPIWEIYAQHGLRVGIFGWPGTWPPPSVDGFVVPSHLARDARTWPPELRWIKEIERRYQAGERGSKEGIRLSRVLREGSAFLRTGHAPVRTSTRIARTAVRAAWARDEERALLLRHARLDLTVSLFGRLQQQYRPHLASYVTFLVDFASHRYWRYMESAGSGPGGSDDKRLSSAVRDAYARTDSALGRLLEEMPVQTTVFVLSEHGMEAEPNPTEIGEERYLLNGRAIGAFAGLPEDVRVCPIARWIAYRLPDRDIEEDVVDRLESLVVVETGLPLLSVHRNGAAEVVVRLSLAANVPLYRQGDLRRLRIASGERCVGFLEIARPLGRVRSAMHAEDAVLVAAGPSIRRGVDVGDVALVDVMPTVLKASGLDLPAGIDGHALESAFVG